MLLVAVVPYVLHSDGFYQHRAVRRHRVYITLKRFTLAARHTGKSSLSVNKTKSEERCSVLVNTIPLTWFTCLRNDMVYIHPSIERTNGWL